MPRKKKPEPDDKEQFNRFIETAGQIDLKDNPQEAFEEAMSKIVKKKRRPKSDCSIP